MSDGDGPLDLRLVPAALATWAACAAGTAGGAPAVATAAVVGAAAAVGLLLVRRTGRTGSPAAGGGHRRAVGADSRAASVLLALAAVLVAAVSCSVQDVVRSGGLWGALVAEESVVSVTGTVRAEVTARSRSGGAVVECVPGSSLRTSTVLAVEAVEGRGRRGTAAADVRVTGGDDWCGLRYGSQVTVTGRLAPAPVGASVHADLRVWGPIRLVADPGAVDAVVNRLRSGLLDASADLPPDARGLVPGAAIGDVSRVPQDLVAAMRTVGLTHITAVSGSHFALLGGAVLALTGALALPRGLRSLIGVAVLAGLVLLVHPQPSVVRAAVMGAVGCLGLVVGRRSSAVPALATAVVVLLVVDPWLSRSAGFALSVLATGGIVLMAARLTSLLQHVLPRWLAIAVSVPVAAQAVCAPVLVLLDPAVSVYAVPANVLAAPALVPATLLGVATTVVAPWWPAAATGLATGAGGATWWVASVARTGAALPGAQLPWDGGPLGVAALVAFDAALLIPLLGGGRLVRERRPWILAVAALLLPGVLPEVRSAVLRLFV